MANETVEAAVFHLEYLAKLAKEAESMKYKWHLLGYAIRVTAEHVPCDGYKQWVQDWNDKEIKDGRSEERTRRCARAMRSYVRELEERGMPSDELLMAYAASTITHLAMMVDWDGTCVPSLEEYRTALRTACTRVSTRYRAIVAKANEVSF